MNSTTMGVNYAAHMFSYGMNTKLLIIVAYFNFGLRNSNFLKCNNNKIHKIVYFRFKKKKKTKLINIH